MLRLQIIACGRLKNGPLLDLWNEYARRMTWPMTLHEIEAKNQQDEHDKITAKLQAGTSLIVLDERGKSFTSRDFSSKLAVLASDRGPDMQFIIGGADGLPDEIRKKANLLLAFGNQTWPHMLARVMLAEQLYRAQQILAGHPYHRD